MISPKTTRVLIIDDSAFNRLAITRILKEELPDVEIVGRASDGEEGLKQALFYKPDLITLDLNMPRLDGFSFLRFLMVQQPTPVIVVSSDSRRESVFQALELGALDFVVKPESPDPKAWESCAKELINKILALPCYSAKNHHLKTTTVNQNPISRIAPHAINPIRSTKAPAPIPTIKPEPPTINYTNSPDRLIVIGASTGGPVALTTLLSALPYNPRVSILIAQHMPANFTTAFAKRLDKNCQFEVHEATQGEQIIGGHAYLAPGGFHMTIHSNSIPGQFNIVLRSPIRIDRYTPSVDMLFESVATCWTGPLSGAVLTGMGNDGKIGSVAITKMGGVLYAESPESAVIYGMPKETWEAGGAKELLSLRSIGLRLSDFIQK